MDIGGLDLARVSATDGELRIGALTSWDELARAPELERPALAGLADCARVIGDLQVRNRGTVGGSLAHADPSADAPAALLALGAAVELRSPAGTRSLPLSDFLVGPFMTALEPTEILTEVRLPLPEPGTGSAYEKVEHPASGFALVGACAVVQPDGSASSRSPASPRAQFAFADGDLAERARRARRLRRRVRPGRVPAAPRRRGRASRARARTRTGGGGHAMSDVIGVSRPRIDSSEKVVGETRYAADDALVGLLHARLVLSTEAHALIEGIEKDDALAIAGVVAVLTAADLPTTPARAGRTSRSPARRSSSPASRSRSSSPRPRRRPRTAPRPCS